MIQVLPQQASAAAASNFAVVYFVSITACCWTLPLHTNATRSLRSLTEQHARDQVTDFNQSRFANVKLGQLNASVIKPPDHLEGLPMQRDGQLNPKYRKEVLLGAQSSAEDQDEALLRSVFSNCCCIFLNNPRLKLMCVFWAIVEETTRKMERWASWYIFSKTTASRKCGWRKRQDEASPIRFRMGQKVEWSCALDHLCYIIKLVDVSLLKEKILLDKANWFEAANSDPEALNIDEFLTFRHPEHSHVSLLKMVNDIISNLDENGDEHLSEEEFAQLTPDETNRQNKEEWKKERILEFRQSIDQNGDGKASRQELLMYNDPENPVHARSEARELVAQADTNGDNKLSLDEVLDKKDIFLGSKMVNTARNIHDEF
ncbi:unnamed protein product [Ixodes hexagonus]